MQPEWRLARNHYLAMAALALTLGGLIALVDPGIASAVALPGAFFAAQSAGSRFAGLAGRVLQRGEALRLSFIAAALQVVVGAAGIALGVAMVSGQVVAIHYGTIAAVLAAAGVLSVLVTWAGLHFGGVVTLRRASRGPSD